MKMRLLIWRFNSSWYWVNPTAILIQMIKNNSSASNQIRAFTFRFHARVGKAIIADNVCNGPDFDSPNYLHCRLLPCIGLH